MTFRPIAPRYTVKIPAGYPHAGRLATAYKETDSTVCVFVTTHHVVRRGRQLDSVIELPRAVAQRK